jgi:hypothetical protein
MTKANVERVARIIARSVMIRQAEIAGIAFEADEPSRATERAWIVLDCAVDFLWPDYIGMAHEIIEALAEGETRDD